jgi:hypothetical protein
MEYEQLIKTTKILTVFEVVFVVLALIALGITICLFIKFKIPKLFSEITGKAKQKQIEQMKEERTSNGITGVNFNFVDDNYESSESSNKKAHSGTVSREDLNKKKRRETSLAQKNKRQTVAMERENVAKSNKSSHQTVVAKRQYESESIKLEVIDELLLINSKEVIE